MPMKTDDNLRALEEMILGQRKRQVLAGSATKESIVSAMNIRGSQDFV
jgi:hypothetical protein